MRRKKAFSNVVTTWRPPMQVKKPLMEPLTT